MSEILNFGCFFLAFFLFAGSYHHCISSGFLRFFFVSVVVPCHLHVLLCSDQLFLHHSHFVPVVYQLLKFHGVVLFQIQLHKEILKLHDGMICFLYKRLDLRGWCSGGPV